MDKLDEIKADIRAGRIRLQHLDWLVKEVENQRAINKEIKNKVRFKNFMKMAEENLALEESLKNTRLQRDHYKNLHMSHSPYQNAL